MLLAIRTLTSCFEGNESQFYPLQMCNIVFPHTGRIQLDNKMKLTLPILGLTLAIYRTMPIGEFLKHMKIRTQPYVQDFSL